MQNKPNLPNAQMSVNLILTKDYERNDIFAVPENKANSKPNKANLLKAKMNVNKVLTKDYENRSNWALFENEPNTKPTCRGVASGEAGSNPISKQFQGPHDRPCLRTRLFY